MRSNRIGRWWMLKLEHFPALSAEPEPRAPAIDPPLRQARVVNLPTPSGLIAAPIGAVGDLHTRQRSIWGRSSLVGKLGTAIH